MVYIPRIILEPFAILLHGIFSTIARKYAKHGQRKMTIPQKMTIITIAKAFGLTYRDMELLAMDLAEVLGLENITTFQNFNSFEKRLSTKGLQDIITMTALIVIRMLDKRELHIAVDSTGLQIKDSSSYYQERAQKKADFFKLHVMMDIQTKTILFATPSDRYYHDINPFKLYFLPALRLLAKEFGFKVKYVSADPAYASEDTYKAVEELKAIVAIKPKKARKGRMGKYYRMRHLPWFRKYANRRWVLESMFRVFKRLFAPYVRSDDQNARAREVLYKALAWNVFRLLESILEAYISKQKDF